MDKIVIGFRKCGVSSLSKHLDAIHDEESILNFTKLKQKYHKQTELHVIIRNPIDRAYSDYQRLKSYYQKKDLNIHTFEEAIEKDEENIINPGIYINYLPNVINYFNKVIIWNLDDLIENNEFPVENKQYYEEMNPETRKKLEKIYEIPQKELIEYLAHHTPKYPPNKTFKSKLINLFS